MRQLRDREDVPAAGNEHAADLAEGGFEVGDVLERLGGQHQVEARVGVGQAGQVLGADTVHDRAGLGAGMKVGAREMG